LNAAEGLTMQRISETGDPSVEAVGRALNLSPIAVRRDMPTVWREGQE
jgi:hypothetical protein